MIATRLRALLAAILARLRPAQLCRWPAGCHVPVGPDELLCTRHQDAAAKGEQTARDLLDQATHRQPAGKDLVTAKEIP